MVSTGSNVAKLLDRDDNFDFPGELSQFQDANGELLKLPKENVKELTAHYEAKLADADILC